MHSLVPCLRRGLLPAWPLGLLSGPCRRGGSQQWRRALPVHSAPVPHFYILASVCAGRPMCDPRVRQQHFLAFGLCAQTWTFAPTTHTLIALFGHGCHVCAARLPLTLMCSSAARHTSCIRRSTDPGRSWGHPVPPSYDQDHCCILWVAPNSPHLLCCLTRKAGWPLR